MTRRHFIDNAPQTTIPSGCGSGDLTFTVGSLVGYPTQFPFPATIDIGTSTAEEVDVTNAVGNLVTVTRNINGLGAFSHPTNATFNHTATARDYDDANAHVNASSGVHGLTGALVDVSSAQTLTNKSFANLALSASGGTPGVTVTTDGVTSAVVVKNGATQVASIDGVGDVTGVAATFSSEHVTGNSQIDGNATINGTLTATGVPLLLGKGSSAGGVVSNAAPFIGCYTGGSAPITLVAGRAYEAEIQFVVEGANSTDAMLYNCALVSSGNGASQAVVGNQQVLKVLDQTDANQTYKANHWKVKFKSPYSGSQATQLAVSWTLANTTTDQINVFPFNNLDTSGVRLWVYDIGTAANYGL